MNTIIVVDDDQTFSGLIKTIFEFEGYQVTLVPYPDDVAPTVRQMKPTIVLMDVHTAGGDTLDILRELRADKELKAVSVIMTSGMDRSAECLATGADAFILKPFRPDELITMAADLIAQKGKKYNV